MPNKRIPIKAAKDIAVKYKQSHVAIVTFDNQSGTTHVVTYGKTIKDCQESADLGNQIKKEILKWPAKDCVAQPKRAKWKWQPTDILLKESEFEYNAQHGIPVWAVLTSPKFDESNYEGYAILKKAQLKYYVEPNPFCDLYVYKRFNMVCDITPTDNGITDIDGGCLSIFVCKEK